MRDRLKDLIKDTLQEWECDVSKDTIAQITDHFVENGVIVLPCKMGDALYMPWEWNGQKGIAYLTVTVLRCISGFGWSFGTDFDTDDEDYYEDNGSSVDAVDVDFVEVEETTTV